jgi:hypothetical protein
MKNAKPDAFADDGKWHKCSTPLIARTTVDGGKTGGMGQTWRRRTTAGWEYRQDEETPDDFEARQY